MNNIVMYSFIMLVAGLGIPAMASMNVMLGSKLESAPLAATILFFGAFIGALFYLILSEGAPTNIFSQDIPWHLYLGGVFILFYILMFNQIAPKFGVSNTVAFALLGQLIAMSIIDHFGLFGVAHYLLSSKRVVGLLLMSLGVLLVVSRR